jgi:magnesium-transporting ATPase (P-type)
MMLVAAKVDLEMIKNFFSKNRALVFFCIVVFYTITFKKVMNYSAVYSVVYFIFFIFLIGIYMYVEKNHNDDDLSDK